MSDPILEAATKAVENVLLNLEPFANRKHRLAVAVTSAFRPLFDEREQQVKALVEAAHKAENALEDARDSAGFSSMYELRLLREALKPFEEPTS